MFDSSVSNLGTLENINLLPFYQVTDPMPFFFLLCLLLSVYFLNESFVLPITKDTRLPGCHISHPVLSKDSGVTCLCKEGLGSTN